MILDFLHAVLEWLIVHLGILTNPTRGLPAEHAEPVSTGRHALTAGRRTVVDLIAVATGGWVAPLTGGPARHTTERDQFGADDAYVAELQAMISEGDWPTVEDLFRYSEAAAHPDRLVCT